MAANAISSEPEARPSSLVAVETPPPDDVEQLRAERTVLRSAIAGALIGAVVCAGIWLGLMAIALVGDPNLGPMLLVGAACGVLAGVFLGGWAGTLVGALRLEHHEHEILPPR